MEDKLQKVLWTGTPGKEQFTQDLMDRRDADDIGTVRQLILDAFAELRTKGFIARANFQCCTGCATYALGELAKARIAQNKVFNGVVYWHKQNDEGWYEAGSMHIGYGCYTNDDGVDFGLPESEIGLAVVTALVKRGVRCEWNGSTDAKILVYA
jgi:hypothetical protein